MRSNKKKTYQKPELDVHNIDKTISIVMASEGSPPDPGQPGAAAPSQAEQPSSFESNPFDENNLK